MWLLSNNPKSHTVHIYSTQNDAQYRSTLYGSPRVIYCTYVALIERQSNSTAPWVTHSQHSLLTIHRLHNSGDAEVGSGFETSVDHVNAVLQWQPAASQITPAWLSLGALQIAPVTIATAQWDRITAAAAAHMLHSSLVQTYGVQSLRHAILSTGNNGSVCSTVLPQHTNNLIIKYTGQNNY